MNWLKDRAYLAAWIALPVMILTAIFQNVRSGFKDVDWARFLLYAAFLTSLGVVFTPTFDERARSMAWYLVSAGLGFLIMDMRPRKN